MVLLGDTGMQDLHRLQARLAANLSQVGLGHWLERQFTPHVTLFYSDATIAGRSLSPVSWRVDRVHLVHSLIGRSEYRVLASTALA